VEEVGSMNIFFVIDQQIITPALTGSILPGITRDSVIQLAKKWGLPVSERRIGIDEVFQAHSSGKLQEIFGTGTAAVISPVGELKYKDMEIHIGNGEAGPMARKFFTTLMGLQYGKTDDFMGWIETL
jgi:branched-chain amino acid aminotransferase